MTSLFHNFYLGVHVRYSDKNDFKVYTKMMVADRKIVFKNKIFNKI